MKISDILTPAGVVSQLVGGDKEAVLAEMATHLSLNLPNLNLDSATILKALVAREGLGSTGVGEGVAIPHAKLAGIGHPMAGFGRQPTGVAFDAIDLRPVHLIFVLLVPEHSAGAHLKALARVSRLLKSAPFRASLLAAGDATAIYDAFLGEDAQY